MFMVNKLGNIKSKGLPSQQLERASLGFGYVYSSGLFFANFKPCTCSLSTKSRLFSYFDWLVEFWSHWFIIAALGLFLVVVSGSHSPSLSTGFSLQRLLSSWRVNCSCADFRSCGTGSVVVAHRLSCSKACGIFPGQGLNLCPLHWQADSYPLYHQESPVWLILWQCLVRIQSIMDSTKILIKMFFFRHYVSI